MDKDKDKGNVVDIKSKLDGAESKGFKFISLEGLLNAVKPPNYLIKPYLELDTLLILFGDSQSFKSFIALDLGLCIAHGLPYHGHKVKQGAVFYICGEGKGGIGRRVKAWRIKHKIPTSQTASFFVSEVPAEILEEGNAEAIRAAIGELTKAAGQDPVLIIIDTASQNMGPGDENSNSDVSKFLSRLNSTLRAPFKATVLVVHHTGWQEKGRTRGAYAYFGNSDAVIKAVRAEGTMLTEISCEKTKDGDRWDPVVFEARVVELGLFDDDGDQVTSLIMEKTDQEMPVREEHRGLSKYESKALDRLIAMYEAYKENLGNGDKIPRVTESDWRTEFYGTFPKDEKPDTKKRAFYRARDGLAEKGNVRIENGFVYITH